MTGSILVATDQQSQDDRTSLDIDLPPNGSVFVIFRDEATPDASPAVRWHLASSTTLEGPWHVAFDPEWGGPADKARARELRQKACSLGRKEECGK